MKYPSPVAVIHACNNLSEIAARFFLVKVLLSDDLVKELSSSNELQNDENLRLRRQNFVHLDNILV